ncbi:MAG TPA: type VI secretion system tube protein Hcp [Flavisolibacter sp.]|jgi:type VI protein secretion system component Hcp|nr:type VI secretion system tube protein Hcp [Flavisolibacter sp.]
MKKFSVLPLLLFCSFCFSQKIQMQINGIPVSGNGFEVLSFSWGASNPVVFGGGGMGSGKVSISSFNIMKHMDAATIQLIEGVATGKHYSEAVVTLFDEKDQPAFRYTMQDVMVESLQQSGSSCGDKKCTNVTESVSFATAKWKWENLKTGQSYQFNTPTL